MTKSLIHSQQENIVDVIGADSIIEEEEINRQSSPFIIEQELQQQPQPSSSTGNNNTRRIIIGMKNGPLLSIISVVVFIVLSFVCLTLSFFDFSITDRTQSSNRFLSNIMMITIDLPFEAFMMTASIGCLCMVVMLLLWIGLMRIKQHYQLLLWTSNNEVCSMLSKFTRQFIKKEIKYLIVFVVIVGLLLIGFDQTSIMVTNSICFVLGCFTIMLMVYVNSLLVSNCSGNCSDIIGMSVRLGSVLSFLNIGISLIMLITCFLLFSNMNGVWSFVLGCYSVAFIGRLSGSVFQKSADITLNLLGQYVNTSTTGQEDRLTSDYKINPLIIAKLVGNHIGGIIAHNIDIVQSLIASIVLSSIIGSQFFGTNGVSLPLYLIIINILTCFISITIACLTDHSTNLETIEDNQEIERKLSKTVNRAISISGIINVILVMAITFILFDIITQGWAIFACYLLGFLNSLLFRSLFKYYNSYRHAPVRHLTLNSTGWYHYVSSGYSHVTLSIFIPIFSLIVNIILSSALSTFMTGGRVNGSLYGLTISGIGMSANMIFFLVMDTLVPNMNQSKFNSSLHSYLQENSNANRGYQLTTTLFFCLSAIQFLMLKSGVVNVNVLDVSTLVGLFIGLVMPFILVGLLWSAINYCSMVMINEFKGQLREIDGLLEGRLNSRPNYDNIIRLQSVKSIRGIILVTCIVFLSPVLIGLIGRQKMLVGFLVSYTFVGFVTSFIMLGFGSSWSSVRRIIGKYSESNMTPPPLVNVESTRQDALIADAIGNPLRDSLAPSLISSIKLVAIISLVIAPTLKHLYTPAH